MKMLKDYISASLTLYIKLKKLIKNVRSHLNLQMEDLAGERGGDFCLLLGIGHSGNFLHAIGF
jgi:hypothetical protein